MVEKEKLNKRITELEEENSNFKEIISELEAEIETEKNNLITERERTQSAEKSASNVSRYHILPLSTDLLRTMKIKNYWKTKLLK